MYSLETMTGFPLKVKRVSLPHSGGALKCFYWYLSTRIFELLSSSSGLPKGQLILKCLFGIFNFPPKEQKKRLYYYGTSSRIISVFWWGELKTPKRHFEINFRSKIEEICLLFFREMKTPQFPSEIFLTFR